MKQPIVFRHLRLNVQGMDEDHIAELVAAKAELWDGTTDLKDDSNEYLCHQLLAQKSEASDLLCKRIGDALAPLCSFHGALETEVGMGVDIPGAQRLKMFWIDQMILDIKEQLR